MINKIISGISVAINSKFGDDYEIHKESVEQGLEEPCFSILCLNPTVEQFLGRKYFRTNQFCVHYFPSTAERNAECHSVAEKLFTTLEYITVGEDLCRGTEMHYEITDGVLVFFVNYDMFVYKEVEETPVMETVTHNTDVKG